MSWDTGASLTLHKGVQWSDILIRACLQYINTHCPLSHPTLPAIWPLSGLSDICACDTCTRVAPQPQLARGRAAHARARAQALLTRFFESPAGSKNSRRTRPRETMRMTRLNRAATSRQARACERVARARWARLARGVCFGYSQGSPRDADAGARAQDKNLTSPGVAVFDLGCARMHADLGRLGRREFEGLVGEAVERALLLRPSPPAQARYVEGNQLAVGGAKGFSGRAEATRCICSLHRHRPCAGSLGRARGAHSHRRHAQAKLGTLRTSVANEQ